MRAALILIELGAAKCFFYLLLAFIAFPVDRTGDDRLNLFVHPRPVQRARVSIPY